MSEGVMGLRSLPHYLMLWIFLRMSLRSLWITLGRTLTETPPGPFAMAPRAGTASVQPGVWRGARLFIRCPGLFGLILIGVVFRLLRRMVGGAGNRLIWIGGSAVPKIGSTWPPVEIGRRTLRTAVVPKRCCRVILGCAAWFCRSGWAGRALEFDSRTTVGLRRKEWFAL